ncbi:TPM domain-containing protein [Anaerorudis cellulosivorans]|uniref:TPM domain-containing protein n=1 Tax=Anaerorudis cellulosivorans TaxID=3397862 RepID=UPI00221FB7A3|nr:TPM domain-containing protein [Seramator thermalis]MCW1735936.1 TPM domain-containing protein [Seramator thermalis]
MKILSKIKHRFWLFILFFGVAAVYAQDIPKPMYPPCLVNDFARLFSPEETRALEQKLRAYHDSTSTQIYVVTVNDLEGYAVSDYAFKIGEEWGVGQKGKDNGAVILIKPKVGNSRGQVFIATGYGLEARLNDAYVGRIVRDRMIPYFRENDYFGGVNAAVDAIIERLSGEFDADEQQDNEGIPIGLIVVSVIGLIVILRLIFGNNRHINNGGSNRGGGRFIFFPPFGGGSNRTGGFGGTFGGGGGGRFGGGGAGGSW